MKKSVLLLLLFSAVISVFAQEQLSEPSWVYLKRAENLSHKGEYAQAILEARKAKTAQFNERVEEYYQLLKAANKDKTDYEVRRMVNDKKSDFQKEDTFPQYHELMGDLYVATGFLDEAEEEYRFALQAKAYFEYPQEELELKYKLSDVYGKRLDFDLQDITDREICESFFASKEKDLWQRIKFNIKTDPSLSHVFRVYRLEGTEYMRALYSIGKHAVLQQRKDDGLFYLTLAAIVWMTGCSDLIKRNVYDFSYAGPTDFIVVLNDIAKYQYVTDETIIEEILFYIAYAYHIDHNYKIRDNYLELAETFAANSSKRNKISILCETLRRDSSHKLTYEETF
jgi:tetratricopeptide (TPR) repeat protein